MSTFLQDRILVTGAGGHLGRRVAQILLDAGATNLVVASRRPDSLTDFANAGASVRRADFDEPEALRAAFSDIDRALIVSTDSLGTPGQRMQQHLAAVNAAVREGVRHLVYTSMPNPDSGSPIPFAPDHYQTEMAIERSGVGFSILRNNWYMNNLAMILPAAIASGQWYTSAGDGRTGYVSREDAAAAAAGALASAAASARLDISGPESLTNSQIAAIASDFLGKPLSVVQVDDQRLREVLAAAGLPTPFVELLVAMDINTRIGKVNIISNGVRDLTGRPPQNLKDFLGQNKNIFSNAGPAV